MPTQETVLSAVLLGALAVVRVVQQIILDTQVKYVGVEEPVVAVEDPVEG